MGGRSFQHNIKNRSAAAGKGELHNGPFTSQIPAASGRNWTSVEPSKKKPCKSKRANSGTHTKQQQHSAIKHDAQQTSRQQTRRLGQRSRILAAEECTSHKLLIQAQICAADSNHTYHILFFGLTSIVIWGWAAVHQCQ